MSTPGVALFCFSSHPPALTKTFLVNFLEVTKEKRIFAARVHKEECTTFLDCWIYNFNQTIFKRSATPSVGIALFYSVQS